MSEFKQYRRKQIAELRYYVKGENMFGVSISEEDRKAGSPKFGDMIARNPKNHADQWLVAKQYFEDNFESVEQSIGWAQKRLNERRNAHSLTIKGAKNLAAYRAPGSMKGR